MKRTRIVAALLIALAAASLWSGALAADVSFSVSALNFRWNPATIAVDKGDRVTLTITNNDAFNHTFELPDFLPSRFLPASGGSATVTFNATTAGNFQYYCAIPGHATYNATTQQWSGMAGTFTVRGATPPPTPGFEAFGVIVAVALAFAIVRVRARSRRP